MPQHEVDAMIRDAVEEVRDRFGADGLRDLIDLAQAELVTALEAADELADLGPDGGPAV